MPDEMSVTPFGEPAVQRKNYLIIAAIIIAVILFVSWLVFKPKPEPSPPSSESPGGLSTEQTDWQVYSNGKYGYTFKYPKSWYLDATNAEKDFIDNLGGELILSNKENLPALLESGSLPSDLITLTLSVYQTSSQTSVEQFIKDEKYNPPLSQSPVYYANLPGRQLLYTMPQDNTEVLNIITILKQNVKMFVFSYNSFKPDKLKLPDEVQTIHDEILKSFEIK